MARVTKLVAGAQIDYRLTEGAGCGLNHGAGQEQKQGHGHAPGDGHGHAAAIPEGDRQLEYRMPDGLPVVAIGDGLEQFGMAWGHVLTDADKDTIRALAGGADPVTGERLVPQVLRTDPAGMLPAGPLLDAIEKAAAEAGLTDGAALIDAAGFEELPEEFGRLARGVDRKGDAHKISFDRADVLAYAAGVDLAEVFGSAAAVAERNRDRRIDIRVKAYDLEIDQPKSHSVLYAAATLEGRTRLDALYNEAIDDTIRLLQHDLAYGMTGHHGDGQKAGRVRTGGLLATRLDHRVARPVDGQAPDPHQHAHIMILNLAEGEDGTWRAVAGGGMDLYRHAVAVNELVDHQYRTKLMALGARFERTEDAWELVGVGPELRGLFSKRSAQVAEELAELGIDAGEATGDQRRMASDRSRESKEQAPTGVSLDEDWHRQLREAHVDPAALVAAAVPGLGPGGPGTGGGPGGDGPRPPAPAPDLAELAATVFDPENGITAHRKVVSRADVLAAVAAAFDGGQSLTQLQELTDELLGSEHAVALPESARPISHLSNAQRYTSPDIIEAETLITGSARSRYREGAAILSPDDAALAISTVEASRGHDLAEAQRAFITRALTAGHGIDALIGAAGTGKTVLCEALRVAYQARGMVVAGATLAAAAGAGLQAESGIHARTIAGWLQSIYSPKEPGLAGVDVLVVDEAAMADDRQMSVLTAEAERTGTKLILIGDPLQLRSPGVGGTFRAVHGIVGGLELTDNRRQRDPAEREALAAWRAGRQHQALTALAEMGRVHVTDTAGEAFARILTGYTAAAKSYTDVHDRITGLLALAGTNEGAERINAGVRAVLREAGLLPTADQDSVYKLGTGKQLRLAVGDQVMLRKNDYRSRLDPLAPDLLNGYRGVIRQIDEKRRALVEWRAADGNLVSDWADPGYIAQGGLSLAYAITVAKSQGMTCDRALVYGAGLDAHTLYAALTRARDHTNLILPRTILEPFEKQLELGEPATEGESRARAIAALADAIKGDQPEDVVIRQLGAVLDPVDPAAAAAALPATAPTTPRPMPQAQPEPPLEPALQAVVDVVSVMFADQDAPDELDLPTQAEAAQLRSRKAGPARPVPHVPATAEQIRERTGGQVPVPVTAWTNRPAGRFTDAQLAEIERKAKASLAAADRVEQLARLVDADQGPAVRRLLNEAPGVQERARLVAEAKKAQTTWHTSRRNVQSIKDAGYELNRTLRQLDGKRFSGGERKRLEKQIAANATKRPTAETTEKTDYAAYKKFVDQLGPEHDERGVNQWGRMQSLAETHRERWPAILDQAKGEDRTALSSAHRKLSTDPADSARTVTIVQEERALRESMNPAARRAEDQERTEAARATAPRSPAQPRNPAPARRPGTGPHPYPLPGRGTTPRGFGR